MTDRQIHIVQNERPKSVGHAVETLGDTPFLAYALVQAFRLFISLVAKRWPELR